MTVTILRCKYSAVFVFQNICINDQVKHRVMTSLKNVSCCYDSMSSGKEWFIPLADECGVCR